MGSRLGVVVKDHSGWEIRYDHWGAQTIGLDIALDGVTATLERVRQMEPMGSSPQQWQEASIRLEDGELAVWEGDCAVDDIASLGPANTHHLAVEVLRRLRCGEPVQRDKEPSGWELPDTGIHVDFTSSSLRWWSLRDTDMGLEAFAGQWPDWSVEPLGDWYEWQERLIGKPIRTWRHELRAFLRRVEEAYREGRRPNPMLSFMTRMAEHGERIEPVPAAMITVPAQRQGTAQDVELLLARLEITGPLPPARHVNRNGVIRQPTV